MRTLEDIATDLDALSVELRNRTVPAPTFTTYTAHTATEFLSALTAAVAGDMIVLDAGVRYVTGEIALPAKSGVVTVTSSAVLPDRRLTPDDAPLLPILASGNSGKVLNATNATHWKFDGIQFEPTANGAGEVITLQGSTDITFDRILIVGGINGQKRGIRGNGQGIVLTRSHIANIWAAGQDSQAFCAWDGAGPYTITDNYLEAASENVMFGGSDGGTAETIPSDILIEGNTFFKPLAWKGTGKAVKNLLELKVGKRVTIRGNLFANNWTDAQAGYAILFKAINQDGGNPWNCTEDVLFEGNTVIGTDNGVNIIGWDYNKPSGRLTRVTFRGNLLQTTGTAIQLGGEIGALTIDRNTFENGWTFMSIYNGSVWPAGDAASRPAAYAVEALTVTGNVANHSTYGVKGEATAVGNASLAKFTPGFVWANNVLLGSDRTSIYPPTTWFDLASVPAGVLVGR